MKVKRASGTLSNKSRTGTWLAYWERLSGQSAYLCFREGCINTPSVGALIQKDNPTDNSLYVIPLCDDCNRNCGEEFHIWDTRALVSVDAATISGIAAVTPRNFAQWASERFPEGRLFRQSRLWSD